MKSKFLTLNQRDFMRGIIIVAGTTALTSIAAIFQTGDIPTVPQLQQIASVSISAGIAYLVKNLLTNSDDKMVKTETKEVQ